MALKIPEDEDEEEFNIFPHSKEFSQGGGKVRGGQSTAIVAVDGSGDFASIQEALNSIKKFGGIVFIKEGLYTIKSTLKIDSNVTLQGTGYGTRIDMQDGIAGLNVIENETAGGDSHIIIKDIRFTRDSGGTGGDYIKLTNCTECFISECWFEGALDDGINLDNGENITIEGCFISSGSGNGIEFNSTTSKCIINACQFTNNAVGISCAGTNNTITSNQLTADAGTNILITGGDNNTIIGNQCISSDDEAGIWLINTATRNIVIGNTCTANYDGIIENAAADNRNIITNNMVYSNTNSQITINGANSVSANNIVT